MTFRPLFAAALALCFVLHSPGTSAEEFSSLEERMSAAEFRAAGLDRLTPEELAALNAWLRARSLGARTQLAAPASSASEDRRGFPADAYQADGPIVSRVVGEFRGWKGSGVSIELENGQVWETTDPASRLSVQLRDPIVTISPGVFNAWFLQVEGYNAKVRVKRVR